jgi:hypothetical protein
MKILAILFLMLALVIPASASDHGAAVDLYIEAGGKNIARAKKYTEIIKLLWKKNRSKLSHIPTPNIPIALGLSESTFNPLAVSSAGCLGVFQLDPSTAVWICKRYKIKYNKRTIKKELLNDVYFNILVGMCSLDYEMEQSKNLKEAILSYKCGGTYIRSKWSYSSRENELYSIFANKLERLNNERKKDDIHPEKAKNSFKSPRKKKFSR